MGAVAMSKGTSASLAEYAGAGVAGGVAGMFGPLGTAAARAKDVASLASIALASGFGSEAASWGVSNALGEGRSFDLGNAIVGSAFAFGMSKLKGVNADPGRLLYTKAQSLFGKPYYGQGGPIKNLGSLVTPWQHKQSSYELTRMITSSFIGSYLKVGLASYN
jgi:hypothetical protein